MTLKSSADVGFLLLGGRSILGRVTVFNDVESTIVEETTPLGVNTDEWANVGVREWELQQEGFYDTAVGSILEAFELSGEQILLFGLTGNAIGEDFLGVNTVRTTIERNTPRKELNKLSASFKSDEGQDRGYVHANHIARTTAGPTDLTAVDWGAAYADQTAGKMVAYLAVSALALDGGTSLTVVVRDSPDNVTFTDSITFTNVTTANSSERKELLASAAVGGDIERYIRARHTFNGASGANRSATYAVGVSRYLT